MTTLLQKRQIKIFEQIMRMCQNSKIEYKVSEDQLIINMRMCQNTEIEYGDQPLIERGVKEDERKSTLNGTSREMESREMESREMESRKMEYSLHDVENKNDFIFFLEILKRYAPLIDLDTLLHSTAKHRLCVGKTQSSKSCLFWCLVWIQLKVLNQQPIVICYNSKSSLDAMIHKEMKDFNTWASEFDIPPLKVSFVFNQIDNNSVPILLGNARRVSKLVQYIRSTENHGKDFVINIDEADLIFQDNNFEKSSKKLQKNIMWLVDHGIPFLLITATPFAIWNSKLMENLQTFVLQPKEQYRCLKNERIQAVFLDEKINMKDHKILLSLFHESIKPHVENLPDNALKYYAILWDSFHTKKNMLNFAKYISKITSNDAYVINRISNKVCVQKVMNGEETSIYFSSIQELFNTLERDNSGAFQHLIGSQFASRANTWRPSRSVGSGGLIAHVNYNCGHMETILQKQRLTGEYDESYPRQIQFLTKDSYYKIIREDENIQLGSEETKDPCNPRNILEGRRINYTGSHTRPAVDSKYISKQRDESIEFENKEKYEEFKKNIGEKFFHQFMNQVSDVLSFPQGLPYTGTNIKKIIFERHPNLQRKDGKLHIATNPKRYRELNDVRYRHTQLEYCQGEYTTGCTKDHEKIYLIRWKPEFTGHHYKKSEKEMYDQDFQHEIYFPYFSTNGKIRVYKNDGRCTAQMSFLD